jgi:3',5'-cyclic AMP phosphodiesterase CpdA
MRAEHSLEKCMRTRFVLVICLLFAYFVVSPSTADFTFVQISDTHVGVKQTAYNARFAEVIRQINELKPAFVIHTGDALQSWSPENAALFKEMTAKLSPPIYIAPGNHDIQGLKSKGFEAVKVWNDAFGTDQPSFEHEGCVFIGLDSSLWNSGIPAEKEQMARLKSELRKAKGKRILIFEHHLYFLDKPSDPNGSYWTVDEPTRGEVLKLLKQYRVEAVLTGHVHRFLQSSFDGISFISTPATSFSCSEDKGLTGYRVFSISPGGFTTRFVDLRRAGAPPEMTGQ